jgi:ribokinase
MVFGPAYLDRVLRIDGPLLDPSSRAPIDQSVSGTPRFATGPSLEFIDQAGSTIEVALPDDWPGPFGQIILEDVLGLDPATPRRVRGTSWSDDLGGTGAGFAAALEGTLVHALGADSDPTSQHVNELLSRYSVPHHPVRVPELPADWSLLVSSGSHGDKVAIGFRGCHQTLKAEALDAWLESPCDLRVAASLPNSLAARVLEAPGAGCRLFSPALRNMRDRDYPVSRFAAAVDILCCNRLEWETLSDREEVGWRVSILVVTEGPDGSWARFTGPQGETGTIRTPAFPRARPPRDTNRAGEAFAATLVSGLLRSGWDPRTGVVEETLLRGLLHRASAAAALTLDRIGFGFSDEAAIDRAVRRGEVD